ncbi:MAG: AAA family ATPase [Candidatus Woesearchaeota archaeon]
MIIGITGTYGSGKSKVADMLIKEGFTHISVRDFLKEEVQKRNIPQTRESYIAVGNEIREEKGPDFIIKTLLAKAKTCDNAIIESIRNPFEADLLAQNNIPLLVVTADVKTRYERIKARKLSTDDISFETFKEQEEKELNGKDPFEINLKYCIEHADIVIENNGSLEELQIKIKDLLQDAELLF